MRNNITIRSNKQTARVGTIERNKLQAQLEADTAVFEAKGGEVYVAELIDSSAFKVTQPARAVASMTGVR